MTRTRTEITAARPVNNIYTALTGSACVAVLVALIFAYIRWSTLNPGKPLFFGIF